MGDEEWCIKDIESIYGQEFGRTVGCKKFA